MKKKTIPVDESAVEQEWNRFDKDDYSKVEFNTSFYFLKKYLPKKGLLLDAGGGPGRYTVELAKKGYEIILVDLMPHNLSWAMKKIKDTKVDKRVKGIFESEITNLSEFKNNSFDGIICFGNALGHLKNEKERKKAISELIRVSKKGSYIFISVIGKFAIIRDSPLRFPSEISKSKYFFNYSLKGEDNFWYLGYSYSHYFTLEEFEKLVDKNDVSIVERVGLEGLTPRKFIEPVFKDPKSKGNWMKMHYKLCTHPSVVDNSEHMMLILRKK